MESAYRDLVNEVLKKIGRNILIFQQIEKGLKVLLPFIHPDASAKGSDSFRRYTEAVKSKTLGHLINNFIESTDYNTDYFVEKLREIVAERNKLVHHFGESKGLNILSTEEGCKTCLTGLEAQYQEAIFFYKEITLFVFSVLAFLRKNYAESNPNIELLYKRLKADIISDVEYINLFDPSETTWENTRIVKLLRLAELHTDKIGDMTLLARAGQFIKNQDSECTPEKYGIKTLKGVLTASGLFEVIESQDGKQNGISILYKSKVSH